MRLIIFISHVVTMVTVSDTVFMLLFYLDQKMIRLS